MLKLIQAIFGRDQTLIRKGQAANNVLYLKAFRIGKLSTPILEDLFAKTSHHLRKSLRVLFR